MTEKTYTTFQVAHICGVRPTTVIKWANQQKIRVYVTPGGHRRIKQSELMGFLQKYNLPVPQELSRFKLQVLIVEDDPAIGQLLQRALQKLNNNMDVTWIQDGVEALLFLGERAPNLVILDVVMPVVDGARVLATLRSDSRTRNTKVIAITGKRLSPEKLKFMQGHTNGFFLKPFDVNELIKKAMSLLNIEQESPVEEFAKRA